MRRKALVSISIALATVMIFCISAAAVTVKTKVDPYFGKYDKTLTVTFARDANAAATFPGKDSYYENVWTRGYKSELNIEAKVLWTAVSNYEAKLTLAIASNDLPDLIWTKTYAQFNSLASHDKVVDLKPYYDKYAYPYLKKNLTEGGGSALTWGLYKNKLMGFSTEGINYQSARMIMIRHDWFVKSGLPKPKTLEDVLSIAKAFYKVDPKNRYAIGLDQKVLSDGMCDLVGVANSFGGHPRMWIDDGKGGIKYGTFTPEFQKAVQVYADLFKAGMIDPAFASYVNGVKLGEQLTGSKIGVAITQSWLPSWPLNSLWEAEGVDWDVYPLLKSASFKGKLMLDTPAPIGAFYCANKDFSNPEAFFKMLNFTCAKLYDPLRCDSVHYYNNPKEPDIGLFGSNPINALPGPAKINFNTQINVTNAINKNNTSFLKSEHDKVQYPFVKSAIDAIKAGKKMTGSQWVGWKNWYGPDSAFAQFNKYFADNAYLVTKLVGYQTPEMIRSWANLTALEDKWITEMISGIKPVSDWAKFKAEWDDLGGAQVEKEVTEWYKNK